MKCKNCGAIAEEGRTLCPNCGEPLDTTIKDDSTVVSPDQMNKPSDLTSSEIHSDISNADAPLSSEKKKRRMHGVIAVILAAAVILTVSAGLFIVLRDNKSSSKDDTADATDHTQSDTSATLVDNAPAPVPKTVIATYGDHELNNEVFLFYYWDEFYYLYKQYGTALTSLLDPSQSFATQEYTDGESWRDYFTEGALRAWKQTMALCDAAAKADYKLSEEDRAEIDAISEKLDGYATEYGYEDGLSYLRSSYDDVVTVEGFIDYLNGTYLASSYVNAQYQIFLASHLNLKDQNKYNIKVRHILIQPAEKTDESKAEAKAEAERIYALWQENPTEDDFAAMANKYSKDPGSNTNGGLYADVPPGQMTQTFNDWCFDENRKVGDHGIVETEHGYHIMYFSGYSDTVYESAQQTAASADYDEWLGGLLENVEYTRTQNQIGFSR